MNIYVVCFLPLLPNFSALAELFLAGSAHLLLLTAKGGENAALAEPPAVRANICGTTWLRACRLCELFLGKISHKANVVTGDSGLILISMTTLELPPL